MFNNLMYPCQKRAGSFWNFQLFLLLLHIRMIDKRYYKVAGHGFCVEAEAECFGLMQNYEPFKLPVFPSSWEEGVGVEEINSSTNLLFTLKIGEGEKPEFAEEMRQEEEGQVIICGFRISNADIRGSRITNATELKEMVFEFCWQGETAGWLVCNGDYSKAQLLTTGKHTKMAIDNALMVMFALATADKGTVLFHAAVVSHAGKGYMFLGKSGTGKSTHARPWLQHIEDTELVNDDNPVVRDGIVYGSPWSGKTPCYRNVQYPLGGIVLLSQAPYNKIEPLKGLQAYAALVPSISGMRWDARIADGLHQSENQLAMTVPMWHLECLPNEEAATLCRTTISL